MNHLKSMGRWMVDAILKIANKIDALGGVLL